MHGLRISTDYLHRADLLLARKFTVLNGDLEELITTISHMVWLNDRGVNGNGEIDRLGRVIEKQ
jgi:hypothetical protein